MNVTVAREPGELDVLQWTALHSVGHPLYTGQTPPVPRAVWLRTGPAVAEGLLREVGDPREQVRELHRDHELRRG